MNKLFFAVHRVSNTTCMLTGFECFEQVQGAFRVGILMPNGETATGIGRITSIRDYLKRAANGWTTIVDQCPICGERVTITGETKDGRLIGSCSDAYPVSRMGVEVAA